MFKSSCYFLCRILISFFVECLNIPYEGTNSCHNSGNHRAHRISKGDKRRNSPAGNSQPTYKLRQTAIILS